LLKIYAREYRLRKVRAAPKGKRRSREELRLRARRGAEGAAQNHPEDLPRQPQHCDEVRKAGRPRGPARVFVTVTVLPSTKAAMDRLVFKMGKKLSRGRLLDLLLPVIENDQSK